MKTSIFSHCRNSSTMIERDFKIPIAYINLYNSIHFFKIGFPYYEKVPRSQMASCVSESITISIDGITVRKRDLIKIIQMIQLSNIELLNYVLVIIDYYERIEKYIFNTRKTSLISEFNDGKLERTSIGKFDKILNNVNFKIENPDNLENQSHKKFFTNDSSFFNERNEKIKEKHLRAKTNILLKKEKGIELNRNEDILDINKIKNDKLNSSEIYTSIQMKQNSPKNQLKSIKNENNSINYFSDKKNNYLINNIEQLPVMIMVNTQDKKINLVQENIVLEILDEKNHKRINSLECYDPIQKEKF